jgi:hypothetical protein
MHVLDFLGKYNALFKDIGVHVFVTNSACSKCSLCELCCKQ